ncbi:MAG: M14 family zinc carboxypeptidase [Candidatus Zixiibacteriota bacterium]
MPAELRGFPLIISRACVMAVAIALAVAVPIVAPHATDDTDLAPYRHGGSVNTYFEGVTYDPAIPTPVSVLGFDLGSRPVRYHEMVEYLEALTRASDRITMTPFGRTHEGRTLYHMTIGTPENVQKAEEIRTRIAKLAYPPASGVVTDADAIIARTPAIAWLGYSIHGDELSGVDAALWVCYQLTARNDAAISMILDSVLILIDPMLNPDGRERYLPQIFSMAGVVSNTDASSLSHSGMWPYGRANHYLFDLNRDWLPLVHPESRARADLILHWNPQIVVDAHEMWSASTFLFSPPREPINLNITKTQHEWREKFAHDQGAAFDARGWSYYTGDWHEEWFPGYTSSWSVFTGAIGILYEQAGVEGSGVKRPDGTILTYAQTVAQQSVSSLANLTTTAQNRSTLLRDYYNYRRDAVTGTNPMARGAFIIPAGDNPSRENQLIRTVMNQGVRVERATQSFTASVIDESGARVNRTFPAGSHLIPLQQPLGVLAKALLEFDPHLTPEFLQEERRSLEKGNGSRMYEVSAWSLALAYDLDIAYARTAPSVAAETLTDRPRPRAGAVTSPDAGYGFLLRYTDDASPVALGQLFGSGLMVRCAVEPFVHGGESYDRGTLLLRRAENPEDIVERLQDIAASTGVTFIGTSTVYSSDGPDLGSDNFRVLNAPRVGLFMGSGIDYTGAGAMWFLLDHEMHMRVSLLDINQFSGGGLSKYNVLILPSYWGGAGGLRSALGAQGINAIKEWIEAGGTLIAAENAAFFCADSSTGLSKARERGDVLTELDKYEDALAKERAAFTATVDTNDVWHWKPSPPQKDQSTSKPDKATLEEEDKLGRLFRPQGAIVRLDIHPEHWLGYGVGETSTAMLSTSQALMAKDPVEVAARYGDPSDIRLGGLLWPEARRRWANTACVTREWRGRGQVILFAAEPFFRAYFHGPKRMLQNAILLGPGLGTRQPSPW